MASTRHPFTGSPAPNVNQVVVGKSTASASGVTSVGQSARPSSEIEVAQKGMPWENKELAGVEGTAFWLVRVRMERLQRGLVVVLLSPKNPKEKNVSV